MLAALFPVTLVSSLSAFGPVSIVAVFGCYIQTMAVVVELFFKSDASDVWTVPSVSALFHVSVTGLVFVSPMVSFVYAYHYVLTDTLCELKNPTYARMTMVNLATVAILCICYIPLSVAGYLNYSGINIPSNMLTKMRENSITVAIARVVMASLLFFTYPLFIIPLRRRIELRLQGCYSSSVLSKSRIQVAGALAVIVCATSILLPDLSLANTLAGGCIACVMLILPGALMVQAERKSSCRNSAYSAAFGALFVAIGIIVTLVGFFGSFIFRF